MFILALEKLVVVACEKKIGQVDFPSLLIGLVSDRPTVLASAMSTYPDLRSLAVRIVYDLLLSHTTKTGENHDMDADPNQEVAIKLVLRDSSTELSTKDFQLPLSLLQSISVLLSIWTEDPWTITEHDAEESNKKIHEIVDILLSQSREGGESPIGLASAKFSSTGTNALPVESVSTPYMPASLLVMIESRI